MKALDFVVTPKGQTALVTETNDQGTSVSIRILGENTEREHSSWYDEDELTVIDNLALVLASNICHPFGRGRQDAELFYGGNDE